MDKNIGRKLDGRYEITELIGVGGMADVYKAVDIIDDKTVAVKVLKNEFSDDEEFLRRFRNESKAIAVLSHPNIVKIYDVGFTDKIQFIVMEYVDGITLNEFIEQQGLLKWKDAVHFIIQILRALQHAHDRGIVHRDIKPQNIMLLSDGSIKVMDFGIARFAREEGKTMTDKTIGSVHYISPEQARGDITDEKSDIYSVGVMMYELLTGKKPFDGDNPVQIALMHMQTMPKNPREISSTIPEGLEQIVMRAMQKDSSKRYQSASEMIKDIDEFKKNPGIVFDYSLGVEATGDTKFFVPVSDKTGKGKTSVVNTKDTKSKVKDPEDEYDEEDEEENSGKSSFILPALVAVAAAVVLIAIFFLAYVILGKFLPNNTEFQMPQLVGMKYEDAQEKYKDLITIIEQGREYDDEYDEGVIIQQNKTEGTSVKGKPNVEVIVSKGVRMISVPDVYNIYVSKAKEQIKNLGLEYEIQSRVVEVNGVTKDFVIETIPAKGELVKEGSVITIFVSLGPEIQDVIMPDLLTMKQEDAEKQLISKGLKVKSNPVDSSEPEGTVVGQSINKDEIVQQGTEVTLSISSGKSPVKSWKLVVPITQGSEGSFKFTAYINGEVVGTANKDNVAYASTVEIPISGSGVAEIIIEIKNNDTNTIAQLARYSFDFDSGTATELSYDEEAFGNTRDSQGEVIYHGLLD